MTFNTPLFLFIFLPVCLILYWAADKRFRNIIALAASLIFFAWGDVFYLPLMIALIVIIFFIGRRLQHLGEESPAQPYYLGFGIGLILLLLFFFKTIVQYGVNWIAPALFITLPQDTLKQLAANPIPLGFSYIAFQLIAYLLDVNNEVTDSESNFLNFALYILLFPKIITGPIARYRDLCSQLTDREVTSQGAADGLRRFIIGFAKKALIADTVAGIVNPAFSLASPNFSTGIAWLVLVGYAIQLYYDFSGYTDMAIGLGQMLGFHFVENFNYPYISRSISEFWRRWHISLSSWFRDYVFYPLEFTRRRANRVRQQMNILIVFLLTGLWHGLTVNFVLWGLVHGLALALEMTGFGRWLKKTWAPVQNIYALSVILIGWVFFRASSLPYALQFFSRLAGLQNGITQLPFTKTQPLPIIDHSVWVALALGILFSIPVIPALKKRLQPWVEGRPFAQLSARFSFDLVLILLLVLSVASMTSSKMVASIYGGF